MQTLEEFPFLQRPSWRTPSAVATSLTSAGFLLSWLSYVATDEAAPKWLSLLLLAAAIIFTGLIVSWIAIRASNELWIAFRRSQSYEDRYATAVATQNEANRLARSLAMHALYPDMTQTLAYEIFECALSHDTGEVMVTLDDHEKPALLPGAVLALIDRFDGARVGWLEVTRQVSLDGRPLVRIRDSDALVLGFLHDNALKMTRPVHSRVQAILTLHEGSWSEFDG